MPPLNKKMEKFLNFAKRKIIESWFYLKSEIKNSLYTLRDMDYMAAIFISFSTFIVTLSIVYSVYDDSFIPSLLGNLNASICEFLILGIIIFFFDKRKQNKESISDLLSNLENYGKSSSITLNIERLKIIRELHKRGCHEINVQDIKLQNMSNLKKLNFHSSQLAGMSFYESTLKDSIFLDCDIRNLCLIRAKLNNVRFINCKLKNSDFSEATFSTVSFENCILEGGLFKSTNLQSCIMKGSDFKNATFDNANMRNANFIDAINIDDKKFILANNLDYIKCDDIFLSRIKTLKNFKIPKKKENI